MLLTLLRINPTSGGGGSEVVSTTPCNYNLFVVITSQYYNYSRVIIGTVVENSSTLEPEKIKIKRSMTRLRFFSCSNIFVR